MRGKTNVFVGACAILASVFAGHGPLEAADSVSRDSVTRVDVVAMHDHAKDRHLFRISSTEIPPGWTTFRFTNASPVDHFFLIWRYPEEGKAAARAAGQSLLDHWFERVAGAFDGFDAYLAGEVSLATYTSGLVARLQENAPWFLDPGATPMGGPGMTAAGATSETTVRLEPGEYIVECYVRDENGVFHTAAGMIDHMTVSGEASGAVAPAASARVAISSVEGIRVDAPPGTGRQVIEVHYEDQAIYSHMLRHNVQLARLPDDYDEGLLEQLAKWLDWTEVDGLVNRAPGGVRFVGGVMEMAAGATGYLHAELEPGVYAWIAEVPEPAEHGMLKVFTLR
jgi:hypothetical protein